VAIGALAMGSATQEPLFAQTRMERSFLLDPKTLKKSRSHR